MAEKLTATKVKMLEFVRIGHNVMITGQEDAGKLTAVNAIRQDCSRRGLTVGVLCSGGLSCHVYEKGVASTVHSYYGLGVANGPAEQILRGTLANNEVCKCL